MKMIELLMIGIVMMVLLVNIVHTLRFSTAQIFGMDLTPINQTAFFQIYCDNTASKIKYQVISANGDTIKSETELTNAECSNAANNIAVDPNNKTYMAIIWRRGITPEDVNLTMLNWESGEVNSTIIETDGKASSEVSIAHLNQSTLVACWIGNAGGLSIPRYAIYNASLTNLVAATDISSTSTGNANGLVCQPTNTTHIMAGFNDGVLEEMRFRTFKYEGGTASFIHPETTLGSSGQADSRLGMACYNSKNCLIAWSSKREGNHTLNLTVVSTSGEFFNSTNSSINISAQSQSIKLHATTLNGSRVAVFAADDITQHYQMGFYNLSENGRYFLPFFDDGDKNKSSVFTISMKQGTDNEYLAIASRARSPNLNFSFCNQSLVYSWTETNSDNRWQANFSNKLFGSWDGQCIDTVAPSIKVSFNTTILNQGTMVNISANITDSRGASICQFLVNDTSTGAYLIYNQSVSGTSDKCSQNFSITSITGLLNFTARANDTSNNFNQTEILLAVADTDLPNILFANFSRFTITDGSQLNLTINASDATSNLKTIIFNFTNPNNQNFTRTNPLNFAICDNSKNCITNYTFFGGGETSVVGLWNLTYIAVIDFANNIIEILPNQTFRVNVADSGGGGTSGGGGESTTTLIFENQNQTSLFFGFTTFSFFVISTPSEQVKLIKFKNIGNSTFFDAKVSMLGNASKFIKASVCNINQMEICETENINILAGENKFLKLDAKFTSELGEGSEGIMRMESLADSKQEGKIVDLLISIDRPPAYRFLISPISNLSPYKQFIGDNELPALIMGYGAFISVFALAINIIRFLL